MLDGSSGATGRKVRMPPPLSGPPDRLGTLRADDRFATPRRDVPFVADLPRAFDAILLCFHQRGRSAYGVTLSRVLGGRGSIYR